MILHLVKQGFEIFKKRKIFMLRCLVLFLSDISPPKMHIGNIFAAKTLISLIKNIKGYRNPQTPNFLQTVQNNLKVYPFLY